MTNPFDELAARLDRIENILLKQAISKPEPVISETDKLFTVPQVALYLNTTAGAIYQLVHKGEIPYSKRGRLYFSEKQIRQWIHEGRHQTIQEIQAESLKSLER